MIDDEEEGSITDTTIDNISINNYPFGHGRGVDDDCIDFTNDGGGTMGLYNNNTEEEDDDDEEEVVKFTSESAIKLAASQDTRKLPTHCHSIPNR